MDNGQAKTPGWLVGGAIAAALFLGWVDVHASEVQPSMAILLVSTFALGAAQPRQAWRWGLLIGLAVPVAHLVSPLVGYRVPYPVQPSKLATFLMLVPAFISAYAGALVGRAFSTVS